MRINATNRERIRIDGHDIEDVDEFTYLGATVCKGGGGMKDLKNRLSKGGSAFVRLKRIGSSNNMAKKNKAEVV